MPPVGFEPTISADERPQTYALDRATSGTGIKYKQILKINLYFYIEKSLKLRFISYVSPPESSLPHDAARKRFCVSL
jgi:hypothetical protein